MHNAQSKNFFLRGEIMPTPTVINQFRYSDAISRNVWDENYQYENWKTVPITAAKAGGATSGTAVNVLYTKNLSLEYAPKGTQTILAPVVVSVSEGVSALNIAMDQTDDDGVELCPGILNSNPMAFKIGEDAAFFVRVRFSIGDVSGTDDCAVGFRGVQAYEANLDDYENMAVLNVISGNINIETVLADASTVTTDTTDNWADGETHELKVLVSNAGVVTYQIDNAAPTVTAAYTFTDALYVVPFMFFLNATDLVDTLNILEWECGFQS